MFGPLAGSLGAQQHAASPSPAPGRHRSLDDDLSSTTPDVERPKQPSLLSIPGALGIGTAIGAGLGALLLRSPAGLLVGAAAGATTGAALAGVDRATNGAIQRKLDYLSLDRRHQILFVLSNPTNPWVAGTGLDVARDAKAEQVALYGRWDPKDGPQDAFRHTFAAALFTLRSIRDHGETSAFAQELAIGAGDAHEADGQDNNDASSRAMDSANNRTGASIAGDGRARPGEDADANGFLTKRGLRDRVLAAMASGQLQVVDRVGDSITPRVTNATDLPVAPAPRTVD